MPCKNDTEERTLSKAHKEPEFWFCFSDELDIQSSSVSSVSKLRTENYRMVEPWDVYKEAYFIRSDHIICVYESKSEVSQSCPTLCNPMDCSLLSSPIMGFSGQGYWSGLPFPSPEDLPDPRIESRSPILQADPLPSEPLGKHMCMEAYVYTVYIIHIVSTLSIIALIINIIQNSLLKDSCCLHFSFNPNGLVLHCQWSTLKPRTDPWGWESIVTATNCGAWT